MTFKEFYEDILQAIKKNGNLAEHIVVSYVAFVDDIIPSIEDYFRLSYDYLYVQTKLRFNNGDPRISDTVSLTVSLACMDREMSLAVITALVSDLDELAVLGANFVREGQALLFDQPLV